MGVLVEKVQCPSCAKDGRDRQGNNLAVYEDGSTYCFSCSYSTKRGGKKSSTKPQTKEDIGKYAVYPFKDLTHKPISKEICERYGVRSVINSETGQIDGVLYPYYDKDNNLKGYKVRTLPKEFSYRGDGKDLGLFGQQRFKPKGKVLIITEGEDDTLAMAELLKDKREFPIVSIQSGADANGTVDKKIKAQYDFVASFDKVIIAMDNDDPGKATAKGLGDWLAGATTVKILNYPDGIKDAGDLLELEDGTDILWKCFTEAKEYSPEGIVDGRDIDLQALKKSPQKGYTTPYPGLDDKLKGLRKGELTLFTAGSGIGKSTITREIGYHLVREHGLTVANIMLEEPTEKSILGYIALDNNVPLSNLWMNRSIIPDEAFDKSGKELINNGHNHFLQHFGSLSVEKLMNYMRFYARGKDVDFIILDHVSMVISGSQTTNERKEIDLLMTELAAFCNETGVGVIAVSHLKRKNTNGGKDKALNEGGQVSLTDLRGSGGLEQLSWSVVALERNQQDEAESNFSTMRVLKNRMFGFTGQCGKLHFNPETGRLLPAPELEAYYEE